MRKYLFPYFSILVFVLSCYKPKEKLRLVPSEYYTFSGTEDYFKLNNSFFVDSSQCICTKAFIKGGTYKQALRYYKKNGSFSWECLKTDPIDSTDNEMILPFAIFSNSIDSAFVIPYNDEFPLLRIVDFKTKKSHIAYSDTLKETYISLYENRAEIIPLNGFIYAPIEHKTNGHPLKDLKRVYSLPSIGKFKTTKNGEWEKFTSFGTYPAIYKEDFYDQGRVPAMLITDGEYIYASFMHDHNVYIYKDTNLVKTKPAKSPDFSKFTPMDFEKSASINEISKYAHTTYYYGKLYYDPYRCLFYRSVAIPTPRALEKEDPRFVQDWKLLIFNKDFELMGEHYFLNDDYLYDSLIILPEGIMVQCNYFKEHKAQLFKIE